MSQRPSPPRGMRDLLPAEVQRRQRLLGTIVDTYRSYGFEQIETPLVEDIDRLLGSEGGENDKLIYKVLKRGLEWPPENEASAVDLGLRYDLTVPLARYFASNGADLPSPFRAIHVGSVFRAERPQKGRYRQFTQCDLDTIGDPSVFAEIEQLCATAEALRNCGVGAFTFRMNHRRLLVGLIAQAGFDETVAPQVLIVLDKIDKIGPEGVESELTQIDRSGAKRLVELVTSKEVEIENEVEDDLSEIENGARAALPWIRIERDFSLVRGMGYYTGPIFEIAHDDLGMSLGGGGRYDGMIAKLSGIDAPASGMSIGFERLCMLDFEEQLSTRRRTVLLRDPHASAAGVMAAAAELRAQGDEVRVEVAAKNTSAQRLRLRDFGFTHVAVAGKDGLDMQELFNERGGK